MNNFAIQALEFGVLGLCAVAIVATWRIIVKEQSREGYPRKGIIKLASVYMGFCVLLAIINGVVQLNGVAPSEKELRELRAARDQLVRIESVSIALQEVRAETIDQLPEDTPEKKILKSIIVECKSLFDNK